MLSVAYNVPEVETCRSLLNKQNNKQNNTTKSTSNMDETNVKQVAENELSLKEMEKSINLLRTKLNEQSEKTGKLEQELAHAKCCLNTQSEKNSALVTEVNHLKKEFFKCTAKCLVLEEDKSKLKKHSWQTFQGKGWSCNTVH